MTGFSLTSGDSCACSKNKTDQTSNLMFITLQFICLITNLWSYFSNANFHKIMLVFMTFHATVVAYAWSWRDLGVPVL